MRLIKNKIGADDVVAIFERLKKEAVKQAELHRYEKSIRYIRIAARWAYQLNFKYCDTDLENLIRDIAKKTINQIYIPKSENTKRYVFLDTIGLDNRGLTQQYLRAMMAQSADILYISVEGDPSKCQDILYELKSYSKAEVIFCNQHNLLKEVDKSGYIVESISKYNPCKIFFHLMPWDVVSLLVASSMGGITKYNINLTDHAFWLGASCFDYNFEFRCYGKTISVEKRALKEEQLLYLPYYPIFPKAYIVFHGFPNLPKDSIKIFTGGSFYKMFGSNGKFFGIIDSLLSLSDKVVVLIAGSGDLRLLNYHLHDLIHRDRIYYIGNRKDINEVFRHIDIYLDTYPLNGGLMEQYAIANFKPLLVYGQYAELSIDCPCGAGYIPKFACEDEFLDYAKKLISDDKFRAAEGNRNARFVQGERMFNETFIRLVSTNDSSMQCRQIPIDYEGKKQLYLEIENDFTHLGMWTIIRGCKMSILKIFPKYRFLFLYVLVSYLLRKYRLI